MTIIKAQCLLCGKENIVKNPDFICSSCGAGNKSHEPEEVNQIIRKGGDDITL